MPNYSTKPKTIFSSANKKLSDIPWGELRSIYNTVGDDILANKQVEAEAQYAREIARMEQEWTDSHEAPYEGNFTDSYPMPPVVMAKKEMYKEFMDVYKENFASKYGLPAIADWFMPQLISYLGNMRTYKNDNGLLSGLKFRNNNFISDMDKGIYRFLLINERSTYLKTQYKSPSKQYCNLVPLVLYAHKLAHGTPYSAWDKEELHYVVNGDLCDAMLCTLPDLTVDEILEQRTLGLTTPGTGVQKNILSTHQLYGPQLKTGPLKDVPSLARIMMTQIWCAHPSIRTRYMVLDPTNWDKMPPALLSEEVLKTAMPGIVISKEVPDDWK